MKPVADFEARVRASRIREDDRNWPTVRCVVCQLHIDVEWVDPDTGVCDTCADLTADSTPPPTAACPLGGEPVEHEGQLCPAHATQVQREHARGARP